MLEELLEIGTGLGVAIATLVVLSWFIGKMLPKNNTDSNKKGSPTNISPGGHITPEQPGSTSYAPAVYSEANATIDRIFITPESAGNMHPVGQVEAIAHRGLKGDRYCGGRGHWSDSDNCEITMITQEDLDIISSTTQVQVQDGQHRRNLVTRGIDLASLTGKRFRIGNAYFSFDRPRPPCQYIQQITEPGMVKALVFRSGICIRCFRSGLIRENDQIEIINITVLDAIKFKLNNIFK